MSIKLIIKLIKKKIKWDQINSNYAFVIIIGFNKKRFWSIKITTTRFLISAVGGPTRVSLTRLEVWRTNYETQFLITILRTLRQLCHEWQRVQTDDWRHCPTFQKDPPFDPSKMKTHPYRPLYTLSWRQDFKRSLLFMVRCRHIKK